MTTIANPALAGLYKILSWQFVACLQGIRQVPLEPPVERALAKVSKVICPGEHESGKPVTLARIVEEVVAAKYPTQWRLWRYNLQRSPVKILCPAAASMVEGAKAMQEWAGATFSPGAAIRFWIETTLAMESTLKLIAEASPSHQTPRVPPANQKASREGLLAALDNHPGALSAAALEAGISRQRLDQKVKKAIDSGDSAFGKYPPRHYVRKKKIN